MVLTIRVQKEMKRALLIGCNYYGTPLQRSGAYENIDMARKMYALRLHVTDMVVLTDNPGSTTLPTHDNIEEEFEKIVLRSAAGDTLIVHYSGSAEGCIVPSDYQRPFSHKDVRFFLDGVAPGVNVFVVLDAPYTEIVAELRFAYEDDSAGMTEIHSTYQGNPVPNMAKWMHGHKAHENLSDPETVPNVVLLTMQTWVLDFLFHTYHLYGLTLRDVLTFGRAFMVANNNPGTLVLHTGQLIDIDTTTLGKFLSAPV
jgi:hypothetical protein